MPTDAVSLSDFISAESLTTRLGITRAVLSRWIEKGLPYIRVGLRLYFHEASVAGWLARQERTRDTGP